MRDEDEVQMIADRITDTLNSPTQTGESGYTREYLRGLQAALEWVIDEDAEDLL